MLKTALLGALGALLLASSGAKGQATQLPLEGGDRVLVKLWMDTVFADSARIEDNGTVILPRVGPVSLAGVPAGLIPDSVRNAYARVFRTLTVEVTPLRRVTILGEVERPGVYYLDPRSSMRDAIAMAGGITEIGKPKKLTVMRDSARHRFDDFTRLAVDEGYIQSGDVVIAEREPWVKRNAFTIISSAGVLLSIIITVSRL